MTCFKPPYKEVKQTGNIMFSHFDDAYFFRIGRTIFKYIKHKNITYLIETIKKEI